MILLDSHSWVWYVTANPLLRDEARTLIDAAVEADELYLSPISLWEITLKASRGRLTFDQPVRAWLHRAVRTTGVRLVPIDVDIACECGELPSDFHGDPADRLIAATARAEALTLVTHDRTLLRLSKMGYFKTFAT